MVNLDTRYESYLHTNKCFLIDGQCEKVVGYGWTDEDVVTTEYSKHIAVQANRFLAQHLVQQNFGENPANIAQDLEQAAEMLQFAAAQIRAGKGTMEHFGD